MRVQFALRRWRRQTYHSHLSLNVAEHGDDKHNAHLWPIIFRICLLASMSLFPGHSHAFTTGRTMPRALGWGTAAEAGLAISLPARVRWTVAKAKT